MYPVYKYVRVKPTVYGLNLQFFMILVFTGALCGLLFMFMPVLVAAGIGITVILGLRFAFITWQKIDFDEIIKILPTVVINKILR